MTTGLSKLRIGDQVVLGKESRLTVDRAPFQVAGHYGNWHHLIGADGRLWDVETGNLLIEGSLRRYDSRNHIISLRQWEANHKNAALVSVFSRIAKRMGVEECWFQSTKHLADMSPDSLSELMRLFSRAEEVFIAQAEMLARSELLGSGAHDG